MGTTENVSPFSQSNRNNWSALLSDQRPLENGDGHNIVHNKGSFNPKKLEKVVNRRLAPEYIWSPDSESRGNLTLFCEQICQERMHMIVFQGLRREI